MKYEIVNPESGQESLDVSGLIKHPEDFHGSTKVHHLVKFGDSFTGLIGKSEAKMPNKGVVILEQHYQQARKLMDEINGLAQAIIADPGKYDDPVFCREYFNLAQEGYRMLDQYEPIGVPVSLERAGLVTTRLALDLDKDAILKQEVAVVTKRTHLLGEPDTNLSVTVQWRDRERLTTIDGKEILLSDFVNPASGASGLAFVVAAREVGHQPLQINHRSISLTRQGVLFVRHELEKLEIESTFYSVGECKELNNMYYLIGNRAVADAGHVLRHFLPKWYRP